MRPTGKASAMAMMIFMAIGGCSRSDIKTVAIDGHVFNVPMKYVVQATVFYLPSSQSDGLTFYVNPEARPQQQKIVGMISTQIICQPGTPPTVNMLPVACAAAKGKKTEIQEPFAPEKVYPHEGITFQWEYRVKDAEGNQRTVADCTTIDDGKDGLCTSISNYGNLVYSVGLRASEMQNLPEIWAKVREMLASWEVGPAANG